MLTEKWFLEQLDQRGGRWSSGSKDFAAYIAHRGGGTRDGAIQLLEELESDRKVELIRSGKTITAANLPSCEPSDLAPGVDRGELPAIIAQQWAVIGRLQAEITAAEALLAEQMTQSAEADARAQAAEERAATLQCELDERPVGVFLELIATTSDGTRVLLDTRRSDGSFRVVGVNVQAVPPRERKRRREQRCRAATTLVIPDDPCTFHKEGCPHPV